MNLISDIITYIRRIIKSPSNAVITDDLIIDYINRFYIMDVDARVQLFDLKTKYQFQTQPTVDKYNMPLYSIQTEQGSQNISWYPVYQGFLGPCYINGIQVGFQTQKSSFFSVWPNVTQQLAQVSTGDGTAGPYIFQLPILSNYSYSYNSSSLQGILRGHIDIAGIMAIAKELSLTTPMDPPITSSFLTSVPTTSVDSAFFITATDGTGANVVVQDSGQFLTGNVNQGLLMQPGAAPFGNQALPGGYSSVYSISAITQANPCVLTVTTTVSLIVGQYVTITNVLGMTELNGNTYQISAVGSNTISLNVDSTLYNSYISGGIATNVQNYVNYITGEVNVTFPTAIPDGYPINAQAYYFETGLPRGLLYYNNTITLRSPPDTQYLVELDAYLSPAAFLSSSDALQFGYMAEYIARGAARKILSDTGDIEQFQFYEPLFREQEMLVWKRSQRQFTASRTETLYSQGFGQGLGQNNLSGGATL